MIKKTLILAGLFIVISCNRNKSNNEPMIVSVSIAPFSYFVETIAGDDFKVNVMVPPGANPHIYEPVPGQIDRLSKSKAYISNGFLGFEQTWLDRFYEINKSMERLSLGENIDPILADHDHDRGHAEGADPHYWVSPKCSAVMATEIKNLLCRLNPEAAEMYEVNCDSLQVLIKVADMKATDLMRQFPGGAFMIYHPNLGYLARDYGLKEITVEYEGKEPPPSRLKELIDIARENNIKTIFVQREYDTKNAKAIAQEIGAKLEIIDPLSPDWYNTTIGLIESLHRSLSESKN